MGATNPSWKKFEREIAELLGGVRYWNNSGQTFDVESSSVVGQCKLVRTCSLDALHDLAEQVEREAGPKLKAGVVAIRRKGRRSTLLVMTADTWRRMNGAAEEVAHGDS